MLFRSLLLPVARHTGNAHHLAGAHIQVHVDQVDTELVKARQRQAGQRLAEPLRLAQSAWARLLLLGREPQGSRQGDGGHDGARFQPVRCDRCACRLRRGHWLRSGEAPGKCPSGMWQNVSGSRDCVICPEGVSCERQDMREPEHCGPGLICWGRQGFDANLALCPAGQICIRPRYGKTPPPSEDEPEVAHADRKSVV